LAKRRPKKTVKEIANKIQDGPPKEAQPSSDPIPPSDDIIKDAEDKVAISALEMIQETIGVDLLMQVIEAIVAKRFGRGVEGCIPIIEVGNIHPFGYTEEQICARCHVSNEYNNIFNILPYRGSDLESATDLIKRGATASFSEDHIDWILEAARLIALKRRVKEALARLNEKGRLKERSLGDKVYWSPIPIDGLNSAEPPNAKFRDSIKGYPNLGVGTGMTISSETRASLLNAGYISYRRGKKQKMIQECFPFFKELTGSTLSRRLQNYGVKWYVPEQEYLVPPTPSR
jgi:hypothetical protein